jgi:DNA primase
MSPFTNEKTASFMVSPTKGIFKCFSSGKGGNLVTFIMEKEFYNFPEAIKHLCQMFSIDFLETEKTNEELILAQQRESLYIINNAANDYYIKNIEHFEECLNYIYKERHLTFESIDKFQIGFAPATISGLTNDLINNGYNWQMAVQASVLKYIPEKNRLYDGFRNRIMFPIKSITGTILGFGGRALTKDDKTPKYINSSDSIIYNKSEILYGIYESKKAIIDANECLLCEGYLDVVMFHQKGIKNIVASGGTALTIEQAKLIKRFTKNVTVMFDNDNAGIRAALRGIDILLSEGMNVKVLILPDGLDPDDFAKTRETNQIFNYILANRKDFVLFKLNYLLRTAGEDFSLKSNTITDVVNSISKIPYPIQQEVYLRECSRIMDMNIDVLRQTLKSMTSEVLDFSNVNIESFQEQSILTKSFLQEQCERKILQYVLAYGYMELNFKEIVLVEEEFRGKIEYEDSIVIVKRKVIDKVIQELDNDGIQFTNVMFLKIFNEAKLIDLKDFYLLQNTLDAETYLMAEQMRCEELAMIISSFTNENIIGKEIIDNELHLALEKSINESLLFYKTIYIEKIIDEESIKEHPDTDTIEMLILLLIKIKKELNFI